MQITDIAGIMLPRVFSEALKREFSLLEEQKRVSEVQARILQAQSDFFSKTWGFFFDSRKC